MPTLIPLAENERLSWAANFETWFPALGADVGFSSAETTAAVNDAAMMRFVIETARNAAAHSKSATAYKNIILGGTDAGTNSPEAPNFLAVDAPAVLTTAGILGRLSGIAARIKAHPNYTDTIGERLLIATPGKSDSGSAHGVFDDDTKPANVKATAMTGSVVRLDWVKGKFDGVFIDAQRGDETVWARLDFDMRSPYEDTRPALAVGKPEERRYRLIYFIDNQPVGSWSDVIIAITQP